MESNTIRTQGSMRLYLNQSADAAACALAIGQGFGLTRLTDAECNCLEVTAHVVCRLAELLINGRDEWVGVGEREKKWELWVARLLLSYLQH